MANLRNNTPMTARPGETTQEVRDRWAGEVTGPAYGGGIMNPGSMGQSDGWEDGNMSWDVPTGMMPAGQMPALQTPSAGWTGQPGLTMSRTGQSPQGSRLDMSHMVPDEVIESPTTVNEAYLGSLKAMLQKNKGNYIVATFLVGTQNTVSWEGILYEVGNDYVTIYQQGRDRYIVSDIYSLRYMEFYDIERRELCRRILQQQGWQNGGW